MTLYRYSERYVDFKVNISCDRACGRTLAEKMPAQEQPA
jgi:hypothetical protein